MTETPNRRPLASRSTNWAKATARWLATTHITPNQLSIGSMVFAALAGLCFYFAGQLLAQAAASGNSGGADALQGVGPAQLIGVINLLLVAGLSCQARLLCNLFDGMLAIEANKRTPDGLAWNEFPDRFADILIFLGLGYGINEPALGWAASCFCVLTAYVRELRNGTGASTGVNAGASTGVSAATTAAESPATTADFCGPMAKPHRMAAVTMMVVVLIGLLIINPHESAAGMALRVWEFTLWVVAIGALITAIRRVKRLLSALNSG